MRHLTDLMDPGYDLGAFQPEAGRMRLFGGGGGKSAPKAPAPAKPPQAAKSPQVPVSRGKAQGLVGGPGRAPTDTILTGSSGIEDQDLLLGKNKLLGQ